jgi:hypothetical protein
MGFFSGSTKTSIASNSSRVVADDALPNSIKYGALRSIYSKDNQFAENILEELVSGLGMRTERMYKYAKDKYTFGLPTTKILRSGDGLSVAEEALRQEKGIDIKIDYSHFGPLNNLHAAWLQLVNEHAYDESTNMLGNLGGQKGVPVYLKDMIVVVTEATADELENGSLYQWGMSPSSGVTPGRPTSMAALNMLRKTVNFAVDATAASDYVRVDFMWVTEESIKANPLDTSETPRMIIRKTVHEDSIYMPLVGYEPEKDYYQIKYYQGITAGYWTYLAGSGTYPDVDAVFSPAFDDLGSFFPILYFRNGKVSMEAEIGTPGYNASKQMAKTLGITYADMIKNINSNPGIADVEQAMLMFTVPYNSTNKLELRYLYTFFSELYIKIGGSGLGRALSYESMRLSLGYDNPRTSLVIQDSRFQSTIGFDTITKRRRAGTIGPIGTYGTFTSVQTISFEVPYFNEQAAYTATYNLPVQHYRKQITDILYDEIQIVNMSMMYRVTDKYIMVLEGNAPMIRVPLDYSITKHFSITDREVLYARSMHYVFTSRVDYHVAWYQSDFFQFILLVGALVMVAYGISEGLTAFSAATAAGGIGLEAFIMTQAMAFMKSIIVAEVTKLFVKAVGTDIAFLASIILIAYTGFRAYETGSIQGAPWAKELMAAASGISSAIDSVTKDALKGLQSETEEFKLFVDSKNTELESANALLEGKTTAVSSVIWGESVDNFYNRTVHAGNVGVVSIDAISTYVERSLALPTINETLGNRFNGNFV